MWGKLGTFLLTTVLGWIGQKLIALFTFFSSKKKLEEENRRLKEALQKATTKEERDAATKEYISKF